jgi:hypothetical protein
VGIGLIWSVLKTAATKIPWLQVVENAPLVVDALGRVTSKARQNEASIKNCDDHLKVLQLENARLAVELQQMSVKLQLLSARVSRLTKIAGVSLLCAVSALILWIVR